MRKPGMSDTREKVLRFIQDFFEERGYTPTVRDIVRGCGLSSPAVVQHHLNVLEKEGRIHRDPEVFRSIQLVEKDTVAVPLLGSIAAGEPIPVPGPDTWAPAPERTLRVPGELVRNVEGVYALRVKGMSMIDALIADGDLVLMRATRVIEEGEMAAVWLKEQQEVTLKRVYREPARIRLQPANEQMAPFYTYPDNVEIQGRVLAVLRQLDH